MFKEDISSSMSEEWERNELPIESHQSQQITKNQFKMKNQSSLIEEEEFQNFLEAETEIDEEEQIKWVIKEKLYENSEEYEMLKS